MGVVGFYGFDVDVEVGCDFFVVFVFVDLM